MHVSTNWNQIEIWIFLIVMTVCERATKFTETPMKIAHVRRSNQMFVAIVDNTEVKDVCMQWQFNWYVVVHFAIWMKEKGFDTDAHVNTHVHTLRQIISNAMPWLSADKVCVPSFTFVVVHTLKLSPSFCFSWPSWTTFQI